MSLSMKSLILLWAGHLLYHQHVSTAGKLLCSILLYLPRQIHAVQSHVFPDYNWLRGVSIASTSEVNQWSHFISISFGSYPKPSFYYKLFCKVVFQPAALVILIQVDHKQKSWLWECFSLLHHCWCHTCKAWNLPPVCRFVYSNRLPKSWFRYFCFPVVLFHKWQFLHYLQLLWQMLWGHIGVPFVQCKVSFSKQSGSNVFIFMSFLFVDSTWC